MIDCLLRITSGTVAAADLPDLGIVRDGTPCGNNLVGLHKNVVLKRMIYLFNNLFSVDRFVSTRRAVASTRTSTDRNALATMWLSIVRDTESVPISIRVFAMPDGRVTIVRPKRTTVIFAVKRNRQKIKTLYR